MQSITKLLALSCLLLATQWSVAEITCPSRPIKLALFDAGYLYSEGVGLDKDFAEELKRRSGCAMEIVVMPRARIFLEMEKGTVDIATAVLRTPERENFMWLEDYIQLRFYAVLGPAVEKNSRSMKEFEDSSVALKWGVVRGFSYGPFFDPAIARLGQAGRLQEVTNADSLIRMIALGRLAGTLSTPMTYRKVIVEGGFSDIMRAEVWDPGEKPIPRAIGFSKKTFDEADALKWRGLVRAVGRDGTTRRLIAKYLPPAEAADTTLR